MVKAKRVTAPVRKNDIGMEQFREKKSRDNRILLLLVVSNLVFLSFMLLRQNVYSIQEAILYCLGFSVILGFFCWLLTRRSMSRLRAWCDENGLNFVEARELVASSERPAVWNFLTTEGDEIEAYELIAKDHQGTRKILIAWHESFVPNPQVLNTSTPVR